MHDTPPDFDTGTGAEWFTYFRQTKFIGAIPVKLKAALDATETAASARLIMTAYAACALDLALFMYQEMGDRVIAELDKGFGFPPQSFLHLNINRIAELAAQDADVLTDEFRRLGFTVTDDGHIRAYTPPRTASTAPVSRPKKPSNP